MPVEHGQLPKNLGRTKDVQNLFGALLGSSSDLHRALEHHVKRIRRLALKKHSSIRLVLLISDHLGDLLDIASVQPGENRDPRSAGACPLKLKPLQTGGIVHEVGPALYLERDPA